MVTSTPFRYLFTCLKSTTWDRRLYFPSEGRRAEDFFRPEKSWRLRPGFNPRTWVLKGQHATRRPPKPLDLWVYVSGIVLNVSCKSCVKVSCKSYVKVELVANRDKTESSLERPLANAVYEKERSCIVFGGTPLQWKSAGFCNAIEG